MIYSSAYRCVFDIVDMKTTETGRLIEEEEHDTGSVGFGVYLAYARSGTLILTILMVAGYCGRQVCMAKICRGPTVVRITLFDLITAHAHIRAPPLFVIGNFTMIKYSDYLSLHNSPPPFLFVRFIMP